MTHKELQELEERDALKPLLKELQVESFVSSDKPDARIHFDNKTLGIEVSGYHRSEDYKKASSALDDSLKKYESIINKRGERGKQISVMMDEEQTVHYTKSDENQLFNEIENSINGVDEFFQYILFADADPILPPNENCEVVRCGIAFCEHLNTDQLQAVIDKKELKLRKYKGLPKNRDIDEYWLIIYVNQHEYDYFQGQQLPHFESEYSRIYLTHSNDGILPIKV